MLPMNEKELGARFTQVLADAGVELRVSDADIERFAQRAKSIKEKVDLFFDRWDMDRKAAADEFNSDPVACLGIEEHIEEEAREQANATLRKLWAPGDEPDICTRCRIAVYAVVLTFDVAFGIVVAAAVFCLTVGFWGPAAALLAGIAAGLAAILVVLTVEVLANLIVAAGSSEDLAYRICKNQRLCK